MQVQLTLRNLVESFPTSGQVFLKRKKGQSTSRVFLILYQIHLCCIWCSTEAGSGWRKTYQSCLFWA